MLGPNGEPVTDSFYFVRQPLAGDGSVTVRVTSLTGRSPRGTAVGPTSPRGGALGQGLPIIKENLTQGFAYAAIMVAADHGVRLQWNYTGDTAGLGARPGLRTRAGCG